MIYLEAMSADDLLRGVTDIVNQRAQYCTAGLYNFSARSGFLDTLTKCGGSQNTYIQSFHFQGWHEIVPEELIAENPDWNRVKTEIPEVLNLDIKISCGCPYFIYWGSQFLNTQYDSSIYPLNIPAPIRDPAEEHILCKHLVEAINRFLR